MLHPDLVLLDLYLPESDDLHVLSFMRALRPQTPVVLMTARGGTEIVQKAAPLGALVVNKPFDMCDLAALVERTLAARRN